MQERGGEAMISFAPLWDTLKKKEISQYQLIHVYGVSAGQLSRLRANHHVSTHTIDRLCEILDCNIENVIEYKKNKQLLE